MTEEPICFEEIQIIQAPGFETDGFAVDSFCSDVNIIHGANAAGKTTLARAIEWLCWPEQADERASLVGQASMNGNGWRIEVDNGQSTHQRDGQEVNSPSFPPSDQRDRYRLSLHDLLQRDNRNKSFAEVIERESAGGYDLPAAHNELEYSDSPSRANRKVVQEAEKAGQELHEARKEVADLRQKQNELHKLRREQETASRAQNQAELLAKAIDFAQARDKLNRTQSRLDEFPDILEQLDGNEASRVEALEGEFQEWTEKKNDAQERGADAWEQLDDVALPGDGLPTGRVDHLKSLRDDLSTVEDRKRSLKEDLSDGKQRRQSAREDLPLVVDSGDLANLSPATWKTVSKFGRDAEKLRAERETRDTVQRLLNGEQPDADISTLQGASKSLEKWLAASSTATTNGGHETYRVALFSSVSLALAGIALALLVHPLFLSILLISAGIMWYGHRARAQAPEGGDSRAPHRESFQQSGVESPESWKNSEVRARLMGLYNTIAEHKLVEKRTEWRDALSTDRETLEQRERELEKTRGELQEQLGASPNTSDIELTVLTDRVLDWQEANSEVEGIQGRIETVDSQIERTSEELREKLAPYGYDDIESSGEATEAIRDLESREQKRETAQRDIEQATQTIQEATKKIDSLESERDELFADIELDPDDRGSLQKLCELVEEYDTAKAAVQEVEIRATTKAEELETDPGFESDLKEQDVADLESSLREAKRTAEELDELRGRIADIKAEIRQAQSDDRVEAALAERDRKLDRLKDQLEDDCAAMVGNALVDYVHEATMETSRPEVFNRAREILATITRGRYRLEFDENEAMFRAFDETKQRGFALDELSSGTRVQVLLAVRIGFVEQQEQDTRIPFLLDETLANTDDQRAKIIIESMIELARNGRQIFYFTAQGDEVAKWRTTLEDTNGVDHQVVDLATVRNIEDSVQILDIEPIETYTPDPPDPEDHDHDSYGEVLDVDQLNPHRNVGAAHLWYVVNDVETLHQLLELGIERIGQLNALFKWGREDLFADSFEQVAGAKQNSAALEEFVQSWRIGRGKPVDRDVLEASGAITTKFIEEVTALAESANGEGRQIVKALRDGEVNRFRKGKADELETYFEDNSFIESQDPLDQAQIRIRVIDRFVQEGVPHDEASHRTDELISRLSES